MLNALLVDDHELIRAGLKHLLEAGLGKMNIGEARNVDEATFFLDDVGAAFVDHSNHSRDQTLVAGDDARRKHHRIAFVNHQAFVAL